MATLLKMKEDLKMFQYDFCTRVQKVLLDTARYLHEDMALAQDREFANQIDRINQILDSENSQRNK